MLYVNWTVEEVGLHRAYRSTTLILVVSFDFPRCQSNNSMDVARLEQVSILLRPLR